MTDWAISQRPTSPFARMNWDSPAAINSLTASRPAPRPDTGQVVVFACGCASWISLPDGWPVTIPDGPRWDGARTVRYRKADGHKYDESGRPLPSYMDCTHGNDDGWQT